MSLLFLSVGIRLAGSGRASTHRVVVGARGCGPECDRALAKRFARELSALGFDAVAPGSKDGKLGGPEAVRAFARDHGARFGVMLMLAVEDSNELEDQSGRRVNANATLYVMDSARDDTPTPAFHLRSVEEGADERTALTMLARRFLEGLFPITASTLISSEPVARLLQETASMEEQAAAMAIKKRERDLLARDDAIRDYRLQCEANDELLASVSTARCVSGGCAEEYLVGVLPDGSAAVVHDSSNTAVFPLEPNSTARSFLTSERLWLAPREGERTLLAEAANFYSRPNLARDGGTLAFIERRHGQSRLYTMALSDKPRTRGLVASATPPGHLSQPHLNADGTRVLYYALARPSGEAALMVVPSDGSEPGVQLLRHALDVRWAKLALSEGEPPREWVAALVPGERDASPDGAEPGLTILDATTGEILTEEKIILPEVWLLDPDTGEIAAKLDAPEHRVRAVGDVHNGALLLSWEDERCGFASYRPGQPVDWRATELCPKHLAVSDDAVFAHAKHSSERGVRQVVRVDAKTGRLKRLTHGAHDAQRPKPATGGKTFAFERVLPRRFGEFQHVAVCFSD